MRRRIRGSQENPAARMAYDMKAPYATTIRHRAGGLALSVCMAAGPVSEGRHRRCADRGLGHRLRAVFGGVGVVSGHGRHHRQGHACPRLDPIRFGAVGVIVIEMGMITPPVERNVLEVKGVVQDVPMETIFRRVLPFPTAMAVTPPLITAFPRSRWSSPAPCSDDGPLRRWSWASPAPALQDRSELTDPARSCRTGRDHRRLRRLPDLPPPPGGGTQRRGRRSARVAGQFPYRICTIWWPRSCGTVNSTRPPASANGSGVPSGTSRTSVTLPVAARSTLVSCSVNKS